MPMMTLLDEFTPRFDFELREHMAVEADPGEVYATLAAPDKALLEVSGKPLRPRPSVPGFDEVLDGAPWTVLARRPGQEVVFGAAGRFWTPYMDWQRLDRDTFGGFGGPRRASLAIAFSVLPYGDSRTLLTFEARATCTDEIAFHWADWYWHTVKPTARIVMRTVLTRVQLRLNAADPVCESS
ncbi:hypothetical protein FPZ12_002240 [Amycolatopsis acidicola]|uniref:DUF2867 domain-containing protein n=1 Tax=Amycolatopsis acidicola TaxID=2596893 RepID=A0A5N0VP51_9PSEU|nr:hypothetical protein [Amycolatopsis acidicola]KAA9166401.1 hypothetical protein FPZ12_002240 [Amycolatopsis acidicola]